MHTRTVTVRKRASYHCRCSFGIAFLPHRPCQHRPGATQPFHYPTRTCAGQPPHLKPVDHRLPPGGLRLDRHFSVRRRCQADKSPAPAARGRRPTAITTSASCSRALTFRWTWCLECRRRGCTEDSGGTRAAAGARSYLPDTRPARRPRHDEPVSSSTPRLLPVDGYRPKGHCWIRPSQAFDGVMLTHSR